jgi:hypothetical protein
LQIKVSFDSSVANAPAGFKACVNAVAQYYDTLFTNPITVTFDVGFGEVAGSAMSKGALGQSENSYYTDNSYSQVVNALTAAGAAGSSTLPASSPATGSLDVALPEAKALSLFRVYFVNGADGYVGFSSSASFAYDPTQSKSIAHGTYDFMGVVEHEFSEVMGRTSFLDGGQDYGVLDLYRFSASGLRQLTTGNPSYFSIDNGVTDLNDFNNAVTDASGDLGDWSFNTQLNDSYNDASHSGAINPVTAVDKTVMSALGYSESSTTLAGSVPKLGAQAAVSAVSSGQDSYVAVSDSAANIGANLDGLETLVNNQNLASLTIGSGSTVPVTALQLINDQSALAAISGSYTVVVNDSAAEISNYLSQINPYAVSGKITAITLTDSGIPAISVASNTIVGDGAALNLIQGYFTLSIDASLPNITVSGLSGHGNLLLMQGTAASYTAAGTGDGVSFTLTTSGSVDHFSSITALKFSDFTDFVASQTNSGVVSSAQVTDLYAAVLDRLPDVPGLAYYEQVAVANPTLPITSFAEFFLQSPEYTAAHNYPQNSTGDSQFITDTYNNLLKRAPETGAVAYYLNNVIDPIIGNATPGTAAYTSAELLAHAAVLADFSQSAEFINDVQITSAHKADATHWLILI